MSSVPIPLDLVFEIAGYCTRNTLSSLSCVSKAVYMEVQPFLYTSVSIHNRYSNAQLRCIKSLSDHDSKSNMIQYLEIKVGYMHPECQFSLEGDHDADEFNKDVEDSIALLSDVLPKMKSLSDLRLIFSREIWQRSVGYYRVRDWLMRKKTPLKTLYIQELDLDIIYNNPQLEVVGVFSSFGPRYKEKCMRENIPSLPIIFRFGPQKRRAIDKWEPVYGGLAVLLLYYDDTDEGHRSRYKKVLDSLARSPWYDPSQVSDICIRGTQWSYSKTIQIRPIFETFQSVSFLHICLQKQRDWTAIEDLLVLVPQLRNLHIEDPELFFDLYYEEKEDVIEGWKKCCSSVKEINLWGPRETWKKIRV